MLKWTSESEFFLSFEKKFADTIYIYIPVQEQSLNPFAAHARRGVIITRTLGDTAKALLYWAAKTELYDYF